ncbi:MAG: hypothetical protein LBH54_04475 [Clostridiales bacterium]|jgi:hypothetical protein|nr:hypothetical protein [Clostridiales bacterium]
MTIACDSRYILLPVNKNAEQRKLKFYRGADLVLDLDITLDGGSPDFYAYYDVSRFAGQTLTAVCEPPAVFEVTTSDEIPAVPYERHRPAVHFSASPRRLHYGDRCYAPQSWAGVPGGRRIRIAWDRHEIPAPAFNQAMTFPCEMSLRATEHGVQLCANPVREIQNLYTQTRRFPEVSLSAPFCAAIDGKAADVLFDLPYTPGLIATVTLFGRKIVFDAPRGRVDCCGVFAPLYGEGGRVRVRLLSDVTGAELFVNNGAVYVVSGGIADYGLNTLTIAANDAAVSVRDLEIHVMG